MNITSNFPILYEDSELVIISKPAGVVVNRAQSVKEKTIQDWMEQKLGISDATKKEGDDFFARGGVVHRIDKETSGCLVLAKNEQSFLKLQAAFKERLVKKIYIALVHGSIPDSGEIKAPVGRLPWNRERFGIVPEGKEAVTRYKKIKNYQLQTKKSTEILSLVELWPESGRTHQIRVHLKYLGYPIVGDYLYAGRKTQRADRVWCPRVFLHAASIEIPHPLTGESIKVETSLSEDLTQILTLLTVS